MGQAEIQHFDMGTACEHDVARLQVAMHHAGRVRGHEHCGDLLGDLHLRSRIEPIAQRDLEALAFDQLHHEPVAVISFDEVVHPADVWMIELRQDARLAQEARLGDRVETMLHANRFERYAALQRLVDTDVDLSHAAFAKGLEDAVVGNENVHVGVLLRFASSSRRSATCYTPARREQLPFPNSETRWSHKRPDGPMAVPLAPDASGLTQ